MKSHKHGMMGVLMQTNCKRCGDERPPTTQCSMCGGHGLVTGYMGDPEDCPDCGCSGMIWPPRCLSCWGFRKWVEQ